MNLSTEAFATAQMTRVLIVDDHPLFREALHGALEAAFPNVETVDASDIQGALATLSAEQSFDLMLLDLDVPDARGFEGLLKLRKQFPRLPVIVVSGHEDGRVIAEAMSYGAAGFVPKSTKIPELAKAIRMVLGGAAYLPEGHAPQRDASEDSRRKEMIARLGTLTPQQFRVLQMIRDGLLNKQIAYELQVGESTVKAHVSEILRKLNVYSRTQAVIEISKLGTSDLPKTGEGPRLGT